MTVPLLPDSPRRIVARRFGRELARAMADRRMNNGRLTRAAAVAYTAVVNWKAGANLSRHDTPLRVADVLLWPRPAGIVGDARQEGCENCGRGFTNEGGTLRRFCSEECRGVMAKRRAGIPTRERPVAACGPRPSAVDGAAAAAYTGPAMVGRNGCIRVLIVEDHPLINHRLACHCAAFLRRLRAGGLLRGPRLRPLGGQPAGPPRTSPAPAGAGDVSASGPWYYDVRRAAAGGDAGPWEVVAVLADDSSIVRHAGDGAGEEWPALPGALVPWPVAPGQGGPSLDGSGRPAGTMSGPGRGGGRPDVLTKETAMHSAIVSKISKARRYAAEPDRVSFDGLAVTIRGDNATHRVTLADAWQCDCHFFAAWGTCVHVLTLQRLLGETLPARARTSLAEQLEADDAAVLGLR